MHERPQAKPVTREQRLDRKSIAPASATDRCEAVNFDKHIGFAHPTRKALFSDVERYAGQCSGGWAIVEGRDDTPTAKRDQAREHSCMPRASPKYVAAISHGAPRTAR